jgi:transcriptional regulator with GAF, ATPase, and Fis domain
MTAPTTIPALQERYREDERALYLAALERHGWNAHRVARELGVTPQSAQKAIDRHGLRAEYDERNPGPGAPRKTGSSENS